MAYLIAVITDQQGNQLGSVQLPPKKYKTGSNGYWGQTKLVGPVADERLQVQVIATVIGSKPKADED